MLHAMTMRAKSSAGLRALRFSPFLLLVLALAASSCGKGKAGGPGGFQMPPMPVEVSTVENRTVRDQFHALGGIQADEVIEVTSEISGVVRQLPFREGQPIAQGALIARLEDSDLAADAARASAQHEQAKSNANRSSKLAEQQVISEQTLEDARLALKVAAANEAQARARLRKAHIRAPWSGLAGRRRVSVGAYVKAGDVITELARVNQVRIQFAAPERYMRQLKPGVAVDVTTPAFPDQVFTGRLAVVDPNVDPESRTVQLVARAANPRQLLKSGMSANVSVTFSERLNALMVPDEAVIAEGTQTFVFVVKADSTVAKTAVVLGTRDSSQVEVVRGLEAGQRVVRAGHQKLFEGAKVMPIPEAAMAAGMGGAGEGAGAGGGKPAGGNAKPADSKKAAGGSAK
jgi:membrane fusion protein, multidrug efflux system